MLSTLHLTRHDVTRLVVFMSIMAVAMIVATDAMAQAVQFNKIDTLGNQFITWLRGNPVTLFFTLAFIITGLGASFNRMSWMWVLMICVGAFLTFGAPALVNQIKGIFT